MRSWESPYGWPCVGTRSCFLCSVRLRNCMVDSVLAYVIVSVLKCVVTAVERERNVMCWLALTL